LDVQLQRDDGDEELCSVYVPTNHLYIGDIFLVNSKEIIRPNLSIREGIGKLSLLHFTNTMHFDDDLSALHLRNKIVPFHAFYSTLSSGAKVNARRNVSVKKVTPEFGLGPIGCPDFSGVLCLLFLSCQIAS